MKRVALTILYLTVMRTLAVAQLTSLSSPANGEISVTISDTNLAAKATQSSGEFTPLNNLPFFPGGLTALQTYWENPDLYPHQARKANLEGTVGVQFRVMPTGHLTEARVTQSRGPLLDHAALKAVALMPRWYPAHQEGVAISSLYTLNVTFRLN